MTICLSQLATKFITAKLHDASDELSVVYIDNVKVTQLTQSHIPEHHYNCIKSPLKIINYLDVICIVNVYKHSQKFQAYQKRRREVNREKPINCRERILRLFVVSCPVNFTQFVCHNSR